ncbi:Os08g0246351, partial [Oryza sativa Japonica Group]
MVSMQSSTSRAVLRTCLTKVLVTLSVTRPLASLRKECIISNSSEITNRSRCTVLCSFSSSSMADLAMVTVPSTVVLANPSTRSAIVALSLARSMCLL